MASPAPTRPTTGQFGALTPGKTESPRAAGSAPAAPRESWLVAALAIAGVTFALLLPALFNGYPILFSDTADYILHSQALTPSPIRAPGYAVWLHLMSGAGTLWLPVVAQALFLGALVARTLRLFGRPTLQQTLGGALALVVGSSAGWVSSKLMPDLFIAMVVLGLYLAGAHWRRLGLGDRILVAAAVLVGGTMHLTNVLVGGAVLVALLVLQRIECPVPPVRRAWFRAAALLVASAALTRGFEASRRDGAETGWNGHMFILSHLVETGLAQRLLQERCGVEQFALCPVRDTLTRPINLFVWRPLQSPRYFVLHDDPVVIREETNHILGGIVKHYPLALAGSALSYTAQQLVAFRVNDEIWRHRHRTEVQRVIEAVYPGDLPAQQRARQQANALRLPSTSILHLVVFLAAAAFSLITLRRAFLARSVSLADSTGFHVVVWVTLLANAAICANLSAVFSRYQSRVSWLLPLAVIATMFERGMLQMPPAARRLTTRG